MIKNIKGIIRYEVNSMYPSLMNNQHIPDMNKVSKSMLNSKYGKFGARKKGKYKIPYYADTDSVHIIGTEPEEGCK